MLPITSLYAAASVALAIGLASRVALHRLQRQPADVVEHEARVHANLVENAPLFLLCLLLGELQGGAPWVLHGLGLGFTLARLSHAYGYSRWRRVSQPRRWGIISTWSVMGAAASYAVWLGWGG